MSQVLCCVLAHITSAFVFTMTLGGLDCYEQQEGRQTNMKEQGDLPTALLCNSTLVPANLARPLS